MFTTRGTGWTSFTGMSVGMLTVIYLSASNIACSGDDVHTKSRCQPGGFFAAGHISVFWFAAMGTLVTFATSYLLSLCFDGPRALSDLAGLTYLTRHEALPADIQARYGMKGSSAINADDDGTASPLLPKENP